MNPDATWRIIGKLLDMVCDFLPDNEGIVFYATKGKGKWDRRRHYLMIQPKEEISSFNVKAAATHIINNIEDYEKKGD